MKNTLAENMLRFGSKNLDAKAVAAIKKLAEQAVAPELGNWINYPVYLGKYKPKNDNKLVAMAVPPTSVVVFIKPASNIDLSDQSKFDGVTLSGITGRKYILGIGLTSDQVIFGNSAAGTVGAPQAGPFTIVRVNAKPAPTFNSAAAPGEPNPSGQEITSGMNTYPTTIIKSVQPRNDYAGFAKDLWTVLTNAAPVKLDNSIIEYILPITMNFVKANIVKAPTPEELKMNAYTLLTKV
jgi:hypothetical protein